MSRPKFESIVRFVYGHNCHLTLIGDLVTSRISEGYFVQCRRKLFNFITVSHASPEAKKYLKSTAEMDNEISRHFNKYIYIVHPFSTACFCWEMLMIPVFLAVLLLTPLEVGLVDTPIALLIIKLVFDVICCLDVFRRFFTGYYDKTHQKVVMSCCKVFKNYVFGLFIFDIASSCPFTFIYMLTGWKHLYYFQLALLLKIVRVPTLFHYMKKMNDRLPRFKLNLKMVNFVLVIIILLMWVCSITALVVAKLDKDIKDALYLVNSYSDLIILCYETVRMLLVVGVGRPIKSTWYMFSQVTFVTLGSVLKTIMLAKFVQLFQKRAAWNNKYNATLEEMTEYMRYKELPSRLRDKVRKYVDYKFKRHIIREEDILNTLSSILKQEILVQKCQRMVQKVDFFKDLPKPAMMRIVSRLRSEIFLTNDTIVLANYRGNAMYFIYSGSVAVYTSTGKEICHLDDGSHFGEIALVANAPRVATVVAIKECEMFKLSRKDFQEAIEPFPDLFIKIRELALKRLEDTLSMTAKDRTSVSTIESFRSDTTTAL